jgi:son of sevenless
LKQWASFSRVKSFIHHSEIKEGIDRCNLDIDACMKKFDARFLGRLLAHTQGKSIDYDV